MKAKPSPITSAEIDRRLWIVSELRNLCISLGRAKRVPDNSDSPTKAAVAKVTAKNAAAGG